MNFHPSQKLVATLAVIVALAPLCANATALSASSGGTFTFNYDSAALGQAAFGNTLHNNGYYLTNFWNTAASDPGNPANTASYFMSNTGTAQIPASNLVHDITATGANPSNQPSGRNVQGTSANFAIDSISLSGATGAQLGLTGIQSFYAQNYPGHVTAGDFSLKYDPSVSSNTGWYIKNNFSYGLDLYDLANLALTVTDANNWKLSGDLLLASPYASMILGQAGANVGTFNLGVGSYAVSSVPVPGAVWLFGSALLGLVGCGRRKTAY